MPTLNLIKPFFGLILDAFAYIDYRFAKIDSQIYQIKIQASLETIKFIYVNHGELQNDDSAREFWSRSDVLVVSNSPITDYVIPRNYLLRANQGRDLAALRDALCLIAEHNNSNSLLFLNSSIYWNFKEVVNSYYEVEPKSKFVFLTDSYQGRKYHAQSYFLFMPSTQVAEFIKHTTGIRLFRNCRTKRAVVAFEEKNIYDTIIKLRCEVEILYPAKKIAAILDMNPTRINPSIDGGEAVLKLGGFGIKKSLLTSAKQYTFTKEAKKF